MCLIIYVIHAHLFRPPGARVQTSDSREASAWLGTTPREFTPILSNRTKYQGLVIIHTTHFTKFRLTHAHSTFLPVLKEFNISFLIWGAPKDDELLITDVAGAVGLKELPEPYAYTSTQRLVAVLMYAWNLTREYPWILKIDDDTYLNVANLYLYIGSAFSLQEFYSRSFLVGHCHHHVVEEQPFCGGGEGYLISNMAFQKLIDHIKRLWEVTVEPEDAWITRVIETMDGPAAIRESELFRDVGQCAGTPVTCHKLPFEKWK